MSETVDDPMKAEFDSVAAWTAEVAINLGADYYVPAGCRGSGSPGSLRWLLDRLAVGTGDLLLDAGAGVGGPAAFAAAETDVSPVLSEPEAGACRAARQLFQLPVVQAGSALPFRDGTFEAAWSLGVLCTVADQGQLLTELRRVLRPAGQLGLLVFVARSLPLPQQPSGNNFPTEDGLRELLEETGFRILDSASAADFAAAPTEWTSRTQVVEAELERRHADDPRWQAAEEQSAAIGSLLAAGDVTGILLAATRTERE